MNDTLRSFDAGQGKTGFYYSLPALEEKGLGKVSRLPDSIRIVLESVLRNSDGKKVSEKDVATLARENARFFSRAAWNNPSKNSGV
jgi:aconitate hydratase